MTWDDSRRTRVTSGAEEEAVTACARSRWIRNIAVLPFCVVAALVAMPAFAEAHAEPCETTHEIADGGKSMRLRPGCPLSLADTSAALIALLQEAFPDGRMKLDRATLELGRIVQYPWLSKALADAALRSPVWEQKKGRGRRTKDNPAVASILDTRRVLAPLIPTFARFGIRARAGSVEKVLVGEVGKTTELAPLEKTPTAMGKKLPYDAILSLRLEPLKR